MLTSCYIFITQIKSLPCNRVKFTKMYVVYGKKWYEVCLVVGSFVHNGTTPKAFLNNKINSGAQQDILGDISLPELTLSISGKCIFKHDITPTHVSSSSKSWFLSE